MDVLGLIDVSPTSILIIFLLLSLYFYLTWNHGTWASLGVPGPKPWPVFGSGLVFFTKGAIKGSEHQYGQFKNHKAYGIYEGGGLGLVVRDAEMIKSVLVKDFQHFTNRRRPIYVIKKPLDQMVLFLEDEEWKRVRSIITPTFSSGKIKRMISRLNVCNNTLLTKFGEMAEADEIFEVKKKVSLCTLDMIASVAFGINANVQTDPDCDFVKYSKIAMGEQVSKLKIFVFLIGFLLPFLRPLINKTTLVDLRVEARDFFDRVLQQAKANRQKDESRHTDFLQLMMDAESQEHGEGSSTESKKDLSSGVVLANAIAFLLGGYDTVSLGISWAIYNLVVNQDVQETLYEEIMTVTGGEEEITYEMLGEMTYLEMVIEESLRLYPPAARLERRCSKEVMIEGIRIPKETIIVIPAYNLHHDPDIFPNPEKFDPMRFTPEEKAKRSPYHYLPFGQGPRNCIAMRLAQIEVKLTLAKIVQQYKLLRCEKTEEPIELKQLGRMEAKDGIFIKVAKR